jgi:membrane protein
MPWWSVNQGEGMGSRIKEISEFWRFIFQRFWLDRSINSAAALTYTTLFAVVPMMTVTFTMLSAIPAFQGVGEQIQGFVFRNFLPASGELVQDYLQAFTAQARQLTWIGVALLAATAFAMLVTVEKTFNTIWRVRQPRRGLSSFLLYWAILSLGPILLGAGFVASTYITSLSLLSGPHALIGAKTLLGFMPLLSSAAAFTLLYASVPNARVPFRHALIGGWFTAALFEAAKGLFGLYVSLFPGYQLIYGAFATVPLFLLWIYLSWLIVLFGAELVCNLAFSRHWHQQALPPLLVALVILRLFHQRQLRGEALSHGDVQRAGWLLPEEEWNEILEVFERQRLICYAGKGSWALCRDLGHYSVQQLLDYCPWPLPRLEQLPAQLDEPWYPALRRALEALQQEKHKVLGEDLAHWLRPDLKP